MQAKQKFTLLALAAGILLAAPVVTYPQAARQKRKRADVIIIPGHPATAAGKETPLLKAVLDQAVKLYRRGLASYILVSGGAIHTPAVEADVMAQGLIKRGIPRAAIIRERRARHTGENFALAQPLLANLQLTRAIVVTSTWHMRKASFYARKYGIRHTTSVAPTPQQITEWQVVKNFTLTYSKMLCQLPLAYQRVQK